MGKLCRMTIIACRKPGQHALPCVRTRGNYVKRRWMRWRCTACGIDPEREHYFSFSPMCGCAAAGAELLYLFRRAEPYDAV
ncbi:hypothetical protein KCP70_08995 [Salmonella enterica subsp. enterica]|nr:hypothetical protein KCP70_08995 [Salmonella enterica subsp. enterica]